MCAGILLNDKKIKVNTKTSILLPEINKHKLRKVTALR